MKNNLWSLLSLFHLDFFCPAALGTLQVANANQEFCLMAVKRCLAELPDKIPDLLADLDEVTQLGHKPCLCFKKIDHDIGYDIDLVVSHIDDEI